MNAPLLTVDDVAAELRIQSRTVRSMAVRGELAYVRIGLASCFQARRL